jgi:hypothetical protein
MNEITKYERNNDPMGELLRFDDPIAVVDKIGEWIAQSNMGGVTKDAQARIMAMASICERKSIFTIFDTYHIIGAGTLTMKSKAMLANYRKVGGRVKWLETTDTICRAKFDFEGNETFVSYTIEQAKRAGYVKPHSAWVTSPDDMLRARVITKTVNMLCPEVTIGGGIEDDNQAAPSKPAPNPLTVIESEGVAIAGGGEAVVVSPNFSDPLDGPAPKPEPKPEPKAKTKSETATVIDAAVTTDHATGEQMAKILDIVADCEIAAVEWMVDRKWIPSAGDAAQLSAANAQLVIDKPEKFKRAIAKFAAEQN